MPAPQVDALARVFKCHKLRDKIFRHLLVLKVLLLQRTCKLFKAVIKADMRDGGNLEERLQYTDNVQRIPRDSSGFEWYHFLIRHGSTESERCRGGFCMSVNIADLWRFNCPEASWKNMLVALSRGTAVVIGTADGQTELGDGAVCMREVFEFNWAEFMSKVEKEYEEKGMNPPRGSPDLLDSIHIRIRNKVFRDQPGLPRKPVGWGSCGYLDGQLDL